MKIQRPTGVKKTGPVRAGKAPAQPGPAPVAGVPSDSVSILGIPEVEFTPKVRDAVTSLLAEVDRLSQELDDMKQRFEDLEKFADQDDLLPILNRRAFVRELSRIKSFGERYELKASLLYIDLNEFKTINDRFGHAAGDKVLARLAATLIKNLRESDVIGRLGGDEFGVVLPNASLEDAQKKAKSLATSIKAMRVSHEGKVMKVTAAIGTCALSKDVAIEDALAEADKDMFVNKNEGKV